MGFIFPILWSGILAIFRAIFSPFILGGLAAFFASRIFQFIGMGLVFWTGIDVLLGFVETQVLSSVSGLTGQIYEIVAYVGLFHGVSMIIAAYTLKFTRKSASLIFRR